MRFFGSVRMMVGATTSTSGSFSSSSPSVCCITALGNGKGGEFFFAEQHWCRIWFEIFLRDKVFNTSVDKLVEKRTFSKANYTILSSLLRFALFLCKRQFLLRPAPLSRPITTLGKNFR